MARKDAIEVEATVLEALPHGMFRVELPNGHRLRTRAIQGGEEQIHVLPGDKVMLEVVPYDLSKGRIISRQE